MNKNLTEQLKKLAKQLTAAHESGDTELEADIQDQIWAVEDQIALEAENEYGDSHGDFR